MILTKHQREVTVALRHVLAFAGRLPYGDRADTVKQSLSELVRAADRDAGVEEATSRLVGSLHRLDEGHAGGLRREFQRNAPAIGLVLETLQEDLLPALRRAGFHV